MREIISALLLLGGAFFTLAASMGILRLPDFFLRVHAITKAGTLGVGMIFLGVAVFFGELAVVTRALATVAFVLVTAPVSSHLIGRAGYLDRVKMWEGTSIDELRELYHLRRKTTEEQRDAEEEA
ncbi:MAG: Na+/H+ antiporter subunit G [Bacteroidetes bacterium QS_9_68_14]|nr:MAG: Na+/H+ antiporter subunit G [Bacteroidetes bacterium QS_9_68_14]